MKKILFVTTFIVFNLVFSDFKSEIKRHYNNRIIDLSTISESQYKIIAEYKYKKNNNQKSIFFRRSLGYKKGSKIKLPYFFYPVFLKFLQNYLLELKDIH